MHIIGAQRLLMTCGDEYVGSWDVRRCQGAIWRRTRGQHWRSSRDWRMKWFYQWGTRPWSWGDATMMGRWCWGQAPMESWGVTLQQPRRTDWVVNLRSTNLMSHSDPLLCAYLYIYIYFFFNPNKSLLACIIVLWLCKYFEKKMNKILCSSVATSQTMPGDSKDTVRFYTQKELGGFRGVHGWVILLSIQIATIDFEHRIFSSQ